MTGPEHYHEAERLLAVAADSSETTYAGENPEADRTIAEAQVHATLALAAATALSVPARSLNVQQARSEAEAWIGAAGVPSVNEDYDIKDSFG
ncbi:hypothetical protein ABZX85_23115 [Streptomyces sp. NPDC004539]|uniref:hypothetical protein n=1 Tax=Streptomyces sp. NPDC004539 TaxID=3154280 RepID=UPI0033B16984